MTASIGGRWPTRETELFREDMAALRVLPPHDYVAATEAIAEVIEVVEKLLAAGSAYIADAGDSEAPYPDVYFRADATPQFGYESGYDRDTMMRLFAERGGDPERPGKGDALDALLWRVQRPGEPSWPSPFGPGPARLARRMRCDRSEPHRHRSGHPGRW